VQTAVDSGRAGGRGFAFVTALLAPLGPALAHAGAMGWSESLHLALATWGLVLLPTVFLLLVFACLGRPCAGGSDQG